jgi:aminopeptidase
MTPEERLDRYARLAVDVGLNLQRGQRVIVACLLEHAPFARAASARAYAAGARFVDVLYVDQHVRRSHLEHAPDDALDWSPPWLVKAIDDLIDDGGAYLSVRGDPNPTRFADLDPDRVARGRTRALDEAKLRLSRDGCTWTVVAYPNDGWAQTVFGEPDLERLWSAVATAVRLDEPDPVAAWRAHLDRLADRSHRLNSRRFDALRFRAPGTDLLVGLLHRSTWGGGVKSTLGISHVANMPTEEVFTVPDARRTEGTVSFAYPLELQGTLVRGLRVRFEAGRAVEITAEQGEALIRDHLAIDDGASRLGEVALVDGDSRVGATGLVFFDTLFDENASCHIAFGDAYFVGNDDRAALANEPGAVNSSSIHTDVMIGSRDLSVHGVTSAGDEVPILVDGVFVLD